jgi:hypothetical protein
MECQIWKYLAYKIRQRRTVTGVQTEHVEDVRMDGEAINTVVTIIAQVEIPRHVAATIILVIIALVAGTGVTATLVVVVEVDLDPLDTDEMSARRIADGAQAHRDGLVMKQNLTFHGGTAPMCQMYRSSCNPTSIAIL